jgi:3-hydroxyisobutyrate dehydrogenase
MQVGIAGVGRMGAAIAARLMQVGHELTVWNRSVDKTRPLAEAGAAVATTPAALASRSEAVITILTNADALHQVYRGPDGLLKGTGASKLFIEMSTVRPDAARALARDVAKHGAAFVECPVGGTTGPAREGKLLGFAGGEPADVARARPLLDQMCRRVEHVGPAGAGAAMKLAINLPLLVYWQAFGEALSLCQPLGLDPARLIDIFADTSGGPNVLKVRGPVIVKVLGGGDADPVTFDVDSIRKDLRTMIEEGHALGRELPVAARALDCFDAAAGKGLGASDATALLTHWLKK